MAKKNAAVVKGRSKIAPLVYGPVIAAVGENGQPVTVRLVRPKLKGKIDPKAIRAAIRKVREADLKAKAQGR